MSEATPRIALVGHCGPDCHVLKSAIKRVVPGAEFVFVNNERALAAQADGSVLLINRVLDGAFASRSGLALIASLPPERRGAAVLISNLPDAQAEAERSGASPGFGKAELYSEKARAGMLSLLGRGGD